MVLALLQLVLRQFEVEHFGQASRLQRRNTSEWPASLAIAPPKSLSRLVRSRQFEEGQLRYGAFPLILLLSSGRTIGVSDAAKII